MPDTTFPTERPSVIPLRAAQPVEVVAPNPIPVVIKDEKIPGREARQSQINDPSTPATTTFQQDLTYAGQRDINRIWENTQGKIALYVILGTMITDALVIGMSLVLGKDLSGAQGLALGAVNSLASGVVSFYFSRTNHTQIGGVGVRPEGMGTR